MKKKMTVYAKGMAGGFGRVAGGRGVNDCHGSLAARIFILFIHFDLQCI